VAAATGPFRLRARAKLNLRFEIGSTAANGLHAIRSVIADLVLADDLDFVPEPGPFALASDGAVIPQQRNLAWRAAIAMESDLSGWRLRIAKQIPLQAGLGGGSADAAAALRGVACILESRGVPIVEARLRMIAQILGSDVPACLLPGLKVVGGTGEIVRQVNAQAPPWGVVLLQPSVRIPTADAYRLVDTARASSSSPGVEHNGSCDELCAAYAHADFERVRSLLHNDFQSIIEAAYPPVREARARLIAAQAQAALLCGSGSCVAGLFLTRAAADAALPVLRAAPDEWAAVTEFSHAE